MRKAEPSLSELCNAVRARHSLGQGCLDPPTNNWKHMKMWIHGDTECKHEWMIMHENNECKIQKMEKHACVWNESLNRWPFVQNSVMHSWSGIYLGQRIKGITDSCAWMCLCYFMQRIDKIAKYTHTEVVRENTIVKHVNTTSLIRSSHNAPGLRLLVQPSVVASLIMFSKQSFYNSEINLSLTQQI